MSQETTARSRFSQKMDAENREKAKRQKIYQKEMARQQAIIEKKQLKNQFIYYSFAFGLLGTLFVLWPAGIKNQMQWWYLLPTILSGSLGYFFALKARKINLQYYQRYRIYIQPKLMKAGFYTSAFALVGAMVMLMAAIPLYL